MNPPSKPPIRSNRKRPVTHNLPSGGWAPGIGDPERLALVGMIITQLPYVEERMIVFLARLLGIARGESVARPLFRSLEAERARINLMKALLENAHINAEKPPVFDEVIRIFNTVRRKRNDFAHGLWKTHKTGLVALTKATSDPWGGWANTREIRKRELQDDLKRIDLLLSKIDEATNWVDPHPIAHDRKRFRSRLKPPAE